MATFRPGKPFRVASLSVDTAFAVGDSTVPFDTFDVDGSFGPSTSGGQVEIAVAGLYLAILTLRRIAGAASAALAATVLLNGVQRARDTAPVAGGAIAASVVGAWQLDVGDDVVAQVNAGAASSLEADASQFVVVRIGPVRWT